LEEIKNLSRQKEEIAAEREKDSSDIKRLTEEVFKYFFDKISA